MLHLLSYERTGSATQSVADLSLRQFTAKAKEFSAECNIHVFGESGYQVPAFAKTCTSFESNMFCIWQSMKGFQHLRYPPVLFDTLRRQSGLQCHGIDSFTLSIFWYVYEFHRAISILRTHAGASFISWLKSLSFTFFACSTSTLRSSSVIFSSPMVRMAVTTSIISSDL